MVIAIDGPAGAGKSTVAKKIAQSLGIYYLDTGAMYRAFTLYVLKGNVPLKNKNEIKKLLKTFKLNISKDCVCINNTDVTNEIRSDLVTNHVSYISSLDFVRKKMVELQREIGKNRDIVAEGRDIGTVVFADTKYKFYLDASVRERALRRMNDEKNLNKECDIPSMINKIKQRDEYDSTRDISPLKRAPNAYYIDSTNMTIDEVCMLIIGKVKEFRTGELDHGESDRIG